MYAESSFFCPFDRQFLKLKQCRINVRLLNLVQKNLKEDSRIVNSCKNFSRKGRKTFTASSINPRTLEFNKECTYVHNETLSTINTSGIFLTPIQPKPLNRLSPSQRLQNTSVHLRKVPQTSRKLAESFYYKPKKPHKSHKSRKTKKDSENATFSLKNAALLTASIIGGVFLYSKLATNSIKASKSAESIFKSVKEVSGYSASSILKIINRS
jgi:hypothetical protein